MQGTWCEDRPNGAFGLDNVVAGELPEGTPIRDHGLWLTATGTRTHVVTPDESPETVIELLDATQFGDAAALREHLCDLRERWESGAVETCHPSPDEDAVAVCSD